MNKFHFLVVTWLGLHFCIVTLIVEVIGRSFHLLLRFTPISSLMIVSSSLMFCSYYSRYIRYRHYQHVVGVRLDEMAGRVSLVLAW